MYLKLYYGTISNYELNNLALILEFYRPESLKMNAKIWNQN